MTKIHCKLEDCCLEESVKNENINNCLFCAHNNENGISFEMTGNYLDDNVDSSPLKVISKVFWGFVIKIVLAFGAAISILCFLLKYKFFLK